MATTKAEAPDNLYDAAIMLLRSWTACFESSPNDWNAIAANLVQDTRALLRDEETRQASAFDLAPAGEKVGACPTCGCDGSVEGTRRTPAGEPCVLGEPLMHGPEPYRWCATHNRLLLTCESAPAGEMGAAILETSPTITTKTASPKLLPCPFCGKQPETEGSGENGRGLMIECATPNCVGPYTSYYDHQSARNAWNTRAALPPVARVPVVAEALAREIYSRMTDWTWFPATNSIATITRIIESHCGSVTPTQKDSGSDA
jgi:hypothetical protein